MAKKVLLALIALCAFAALASHSNAEEAGATKRGRDLVDQLVEEVGDLDDANGKINTGKELKEAKVVSQILEVGRNTPTVLFNLYQDFGKPIADACETILEKREVCRFFQKERRIQNQRNG